MKICKDCKYYIKDGILSSHEADRCHKYGEIIDYVNGGNTIITGPCVLIRSSNICGPEAKWFEEKD